MKAILSIILGSAILFSFSQCKNSKEMTYKTVKHAQFKITKATYKNWVAGVKGGGSGINVFIAIPNLETDKITIDSLFFRGQKVKAEHKGLLYVGYFKTSTNQKKDIIMSGDVNAEYGNKAPIKELKFPFDLKDNEVVISYKKRGKIKYLKQTLEQEEPNMHP